MTIELTCNGCNNLLRVDDEHAGKHARCPKCETVNQIPTRSETPWPSTTRDDSQDLFGSMYPPSNNPPDPGHYSQPVEQPANQINPFAAPVQNQPPHLEQVYQQQQYYLRPHKGPLILTLGIISLFCNIMFLVPGILAWVLGAVDLGRMRRMEIDSSGYGLTMAGMILGIIGTCVWAILLIVMALDG